MGNFRLFEIAGGATASIIGVTLQNGYMPGGDGGAILSRGNLTVSGCVLQNNEASFGGAIATRKQDFPAGGSDMSNLVIENSTISGNKSTLSGGGIEVVDGNLTVSSSFLCCNTTVLGDGGGISVRQGDLIGPLFLPAVSLTGTEVSGNMSQLTGGGISCEGHLSLNAGTVISGNTVTNGGAVLTRGGGVFLGKGSLSVSGNPTIGSNEADQGDGLYIAEGAVRNPGAITFQDDSEFNGNPA